MNGAGKEQEGWRQVEIKTCETGYEHESGTTSHQVNADFIIYLLSFVKVPTRGRCDPTL